MYKFIRIYRFKIKNDIKIKLKNWNTMRNATTVDYRCDLFNATNALKHLIDQSEENILQIDQSKDISKRL